MKLHGVRASCLRFFNVFGRNQRFDPYGNVIPIFATRIAGGVPLTVYGDGEQTRDFTFVGDVVQAMLDAVRSPWCGVANVGGGSRASLNRVVDIVRDICGEVCLTRRPRATGDVRHTAADISVAAAAFGYTPRTSLPEGLAAMVASERSLQEAMAS
jgi:nucleoside-diphosphate-sugar epimerase